MPAPVGGSHDLDPEMRELLEGHLAAILRELDHTREDMKSTMAQLREDQRLDNEALHARIEAVEMRATKVERRLDFLNALHLMAAAVLGWIVKKVFSE